MFWQSSRNWTRAGCSMTWRAGGRALQAVQHPPAQPCLGALLCWWNYKQTCHLNVAAGMQLRDRHWFPTLFQIHLLTALSGGASYLPDCLFSTIIWGTKIKYLAIQEQAWAASSQPTGILIANASLKKHCSKDMPPIWDVQIKSGICFINI